MTKQFGLAALESFTDRTKTTITLSEEHRKPLEPWIAAPGTPQQVALRCLIILRKAEGWSDLRTAVDLGINRHTCRLWRLRMLADGPAGLWDVAEGRGRKPQAGSAASGSKRLARAAPAAKIDKWRKCIAI